MPELYANEKIEWEAYYRSYVDTYLQRDIRDLVQVADEMQFYNFMTIVAAHTSKPVVYEELATAAGISAPTAKKWLSILEVFTNLKTEIGTGSVICMANDLLPVDEKNWYVPVWLI
ncbi:MAG: DUF4143 domain-containing protein [Clostridiales bacterium]|nr:DUF4143 domain-containing protein [Clostridiales bacterium]